MLSKIGGIITFLFNAIILGMQIFQNYGSWRYDRSSIL